MAVATLPDGEYRVRVRGVDATGLEGRDAEWPLTLDARPEPPVLVSPAPGANPKMPSWGGSKFAISTFLARLDQQFTNVQKSATPAAPTNTASAKSR